MMRKILGTVFIYLFSISFISAQTTVKKPAPAHKESTNKSELKAGAKAGWHGIKEAGRAVGHTSKRVVKTVRHDVKGTEKDVKKDVKK